VDEQRCNLAQEDVIHGNLKLFLQYLENKQIININEVEKDGAKMQRLISEIM
jgi:tRNA A-37 threonylcarbamoyl transferase component Bud32